MNNEKKAPVLTLEHLAPYLPYGVEVKTEDGIFKVVGWVDDIGICLDTIFYGANAIPEYKLILRPLSDLTKEIEHNGRSFVPMDTVGDIPNNFCKCDFVTDWCDKGGDFNEYVKEFANGVFGNHHLDYLPFGFVQKLIEWNFDVFGLLDQNLAIDINSIEGKETKGNG